MSNSSRQQQLLKARELSEKKAEELRLKEISDLKARIANQEKELAPPPKSKKRVRFLTEPVTIPPIEEKNKQESEDFELTPVKERVASPIQETEFEEDFPSEEDPEPEPEPPKKIMRTIQKDARANPSTKVPTQKQVSTLAKRPRPNPPENPPQSLVESVTEKTPGILSTVVDSAKPHALKLGASIASQCVLLLGTGLLVFGKNYLSKMGSPPQFSHNYPSYPPPQNYPSAQSTPPPAPNYPVLHNSNQPGVEKSLFGAPWK